MKFSNILYVIIVLCLTFTIFTYAPIINKYWYFYILAIVLAIINRVYKTRIMIPLIVYAMIVLFNTIMGDFIFPNVFIAIIEIASLFIPVSILLYLLGKKETKTSHLLLDSFLVLTIFTAIVSLGINATNPGIIRQSTIYYNNDDADYLRAYYAMGLSNYLLPHGLCILVPPLVLFVKNASTFLNRIFYIISLVSLLTLVYISGSTTSLLLSIISLILSFTLSTRNGEKRNYRTLTWVLVILSPIILFSDIQLYIIKVISDISGDANLYQDKVLEFESLASTGEAGLDMTTRADLFLKSVKEFALHPIWGTSSAVGGHNALIDRGAALGIIGIIPLFLYFKNVYVWSRLYIDNKIMPFVVLSIFNGLVLLFTKNMMCWEVLVILFLIMPVMFYLNTIERAQKSINITKVKRY